MNVDFPYSDDSADGLALRGGKVWPGFNSINMLTEAPSTDGSIVLLSAKERTSLLDIGTGILSRFVDSALLQLAYLAKI